ncbi:Fatty acid amide hydrolase [Actinidia chinensis var. chinensis]|uniref:Fatty acid amide hydrolase n=1 Tax=Actinidia chinensis var. chinensis TaxID=1590841 RepID=A0A2R6RGS9_ACTCC|nr:Fatty acid amide hydrolase [Actinidia chinensis var. chinensis]
MGKKLVMVPANEVDLSEVEYKPEVIQAPHMAGLSLKLYVMLIEAPLIGSLIISYLKKQNKMAGMLRNTVIPETPMFKPEFPPLEPEPGVVGLEEDGKPEDRVELALKCLPHYDAATCSNPVTPDYEHPVGSVKNELTTTGKRLTTVPEPSFSILFQMPSKLLSGTNDFPKSFHNDRTTRNPHAYERYTGGSSSGPAAIVASGLCSAALGTDGGGSIRIPSSLCGVVGLKTTYGRTDMRGSICDAGTVEVIGPIASNVEDVMLVYSAILGSSPADRISLRPSPPCLPNLSSYESSDALGSLRLGKYTEWFNDVFSTDISQKCDNILALLLEKHGCKTIDIVIPELHEMRLAHLVSIGSESLCVLTPDCEDGKDVKLTYDTRTNLALFQSFTASDYVAAQCLRRRVMYHHMEIFQKVDVIVTPTTGMTAPEIPPNALKFGETDLQVTVNLMRFIIAPNLLGFPAISVPVGYDKQGLPIGLQLIGRPWGEASILRLAAAVEDLCAEPKKRPQTFYETLKRN